MPSRIDMFFNPGKYVEREEYEKSAVSRSLAEWRNLADFLGLDRNANPDAMQEATYYACMKILREAIGRMPMRLMREDRDGGGISDAVEHPLYDTLFREPNRYTNATTFWAAIEQSRNHFGNAYVLKTGYGTNRDPYQLWMMPFEEVEVWKDDMGYISDIPDIYYIWRHSGKTRVFKSEEVLHFRSTDTRDGIMGIPVIDRLGALIDGGRRSQDFQNSLIASGMSGKGVLQYTGSLSDPAAKKFADEMERFITGDYVRNEARALIPIPVGTQLTPLNIKLSDAQFEELKKYNSIQIACAFGIKPSQIGDQTKSSYASAQAQNESFYVDTLLAICKSYEETITSGLLTRAERRKRYMVAFDTSTTLQASFETLVKTLGQGVENKIYTPDEARRMLKLPAIEGGDRLYTNGSTIPLVMAGMQYLPAPSDSEGGE